MKFILKETLNNVNDIQAVAQMLNCSEKEAAEKLDNDEIYYNPDITNYTDFGRLQFEDNPYLMQKKYIDMDLLADDLSVMDIEDLEQLLGYSRKYLANKPKYTLADLYMEKYEPKGTDQKYIDLESFGKDQLKEYPDKYLLSDLGFIEL